MIFFPANKHRRKAVAEHGTLNGIDFLEVVVDVSLPVKYQPPTILIHFIKPLNSFNEDLLVEGGEQIRKLTVNAATIGTGEQANVLIVQLDKIGDNSKYTLRLLQKSDNVRFDPLLSEVDFSFAVDNQVNFDCQAESINSSEPVRQPDINYLAKDYSSFRRLMLDRMAVLIPQWKERNPGDFGITLVELLAYVGDYLSYQQDAVATEAYLGTARKRISVRRHARLVDYFMHDGCNSRVWVQVRVNNDAELAKGTKLMTRISGMKVIITPHSSDYEQALEARPEVFETLHKAFLYHTHNEMPLYNWGSNSCCLPKGTTQANLLGNFPFLKKGDVLILTEVRGPYSGQPEDADPTRRHAVRLTKVTSTTDPLGGRFNDPPNDDPIPITNIEWDEKDALPFSLCITLPVNDTQSLDYRKNASVALGNIVLADHGLTIENEALTPCTTPQCFRPCLKYRPLTQAAVFDWKAPASAAFQWKMNDVLPTVTLYAVDRDNEIWSARRDLLASSELAKEFVVEIDDDGTSFLRFGDGQYGARLEVGSVLQAIYRVGNGVRGNVGRESIVHIVSNDTAILAVGNPLPARGGVEPETIEQVRRNAPYAFRTQERAITPEDYAAAAARHPGVQRAAATFRWTGSWYTVFLTVDRFGGLEIDDAFKEELRQQLERYRRAGHDLEIDSPRYVSLVIEMQVVVQQDHFRSIVKAALLKVFSNRTLADNQLGVFHPDNFTFGQTVYLSPLYAAAQRVAGVESVQITKFGQLGISGNKALDEGKLTLGRLEIARCDNDPNYPERGVFSLVLKGGK